MRDAAGFHLVSSNRLEELARHLAARVAEPVAEDAPLWPETILIPQPTLRRWLQAWLAQNLGIAANLRFPTPSEFTWELMRADRPELPETRSEEHTSELQSLMRISNAVFCLKKKK